MWYDGEEDYRYEKRWVKLEFEVEREVYLNDYESEEEYEECINDDGNWLSYLLEGRYNCDDDPKYWTVDRI